MIFWRQRVLLALLERLPNKNASRIQLVKWLFLLRHEEHIDHFGSFYDFVPYRFGPFSFLAYKEINELANLDMLKSKDDHYYLIDAKNKRFSTDLSHKVNNSIGKIVKVYSSMSNKELLEYIYDHYKWYASKSELSKKSFNYSTKTKPTAIYTIGYEGLSIDAFLSEIIKEGIRSIIDIRHRSFSRKYGFSGPRLEKRCSDFELEYHHFPEVGIPSNIRKQVTDRSALWNIYGVSVIPNVTETLNVIAKLCSQESSILLCFEKNPQDCHRHIVAEEISKRIKLPIVHYNYEVKKWGKESKYLSP